ncbi:MAG TPA: pyridoxamine 5'-phosphate oxidase family protein [Thermomicrobiales bacterium]|nr:pyridoxamine 5'-phosphate oxidase family protein [Thermomicrobiales bacterium]
MGVIRVLPPDEIERLLHDAVVGRIACGGDGEGEAARPYLVPLAYGYDGEAVYAHSGPGRKIRLMRRQPLVAFEVDAVEAADRWRSVIADAIYEEIVEPAARLAALRVVYPPPATLPDLRPETIVYRLRLTAKTGRYETPDDDER